MTDRIDAAGSSSEGDAQGEAPLEGNRGPVPSSGSLSALSGVFALSGAAALVFQVLFFRLAGLALGHSVHAAAVVLFSFMAGLGLGNGIAAKFVRRVRSPLRLFVQIELSIALTGAGLVVVFPWITQALVPLFQPFLDGGVWLDALRFAVAFALFVVPAIAMGMTLPVLVGALSSQDANFGRVLGRLYGWNTLGAVGGVLLAERVLVTHLGIAGAGLFAGGLDVVAAGAVWWLRRSGLRDTLTERDRAEISEVPRQTGMLLGATFVSGALLLALEVVWFRFFLLLSPAFSWNLALMLATVLAGIASGGLLGAVWFRRRSEGHRGAPSVALLAGASVAGLYAGLVWGWPRFPDVPLVDVYIYLMFPVSLLSGLLFTQLGRALEAGGLSPTRATGWLALSNTAGSALGSLLGGFVLIPVLGVERSFALLALGYAGVAILAGLGLRREAAEVPWRFRAAWPAGVAFVAALGVFPSGALDTRILSRPGSIRTQMFERGHTLVAMREATTETIQYFRHDLLGEPHFYVLATNNHAMSGTPLRGRRYMKLYVYWPIAVNPQIRDALLISYGVGVTAKGLTDTAQLERIDVVDISEPILEMNEIVYPDPEEHPLNDPRVHVHIEDGRFFLQTTDRKFDLITGEPPPPRNAGVSNLYSQEYFQLMHDRLRDGGIVTYWLPVSQLRIVEARAIMQGFCAVFENCSLWNGFSAEWMMVAVKEPKGPASPAAFASPWRDPVLGPDLLALGLADPAALGATFIADGARLRRWMGDVPPLLDNFPQRIASRSFLDGPALQGEQGQFAAFMADPGAEANFLSSPHVAQYWPRAFRRPDPDRERVRRFLLRDLWMSPPGRNLHAALETPALDPYVPWILGSDADAQAILARAAERDPGLLSSDELPAGVYSHLAASALSQRDLARAEAYLETAAARMEEEGQTVPDTDLQLRVYLLLAAGQRERALALMQTWAASAVATDPFYARRARTFWDWAREVFDIDVSFEELAS